MSCYLSRSYFASSYFGFLDPGRPGVAQATNDSKVYGEIAARLSRSGSFSRIAIPGGRSGSPQNACGYPSAEIVPGSWSETDGPNPGEVLRQVNFSLLISVRDSVPTAAFGLLDRLGCLAQNLIDATDLSGLVLAPRTRLARGEYVASTAYPEQKLRIFGEFAYRFHRDMGRNSQA